jgi:hypothetical protein
MVDCGFEFVVVIVMLERDGGVPWAGIGFDAGRRPRSKTAIVGIKSNSEAPTKNLRTKHT